MKTIDENSLNDTVTQAITLHGKSRDALIPILSEINSEYGYIPAEAYKVVQRQVNQPESQVFVSESQLFGLATFYHMFSTKPVGKHVVRFCESAPCHVMGGRQLFEAIKERLNLKPGETTPDGRWSLVTTSCLGTCGVGPVMLIDEDIYGNIKPEQLDEILARYEENQ